MFSETELVTVRRAYAKQILAAARIDDPRLEAAFAQVRREHYLGAGPWPIVRYDADEDARLKAPGWCLAFR